MTAVQNRGHRRGADSARWVGEDAGYVASHDRVRVLRGPASAHPCGWCGVVSADNEWAFSYNAGERTKFCPDRRLFYSTSADDYAVKCPTHHRIWDALVRTGSAPVVEAAGWLLDRMEERGGVADAGELNAEAAKASIPRDRLSVARRRYTNVESRPASGRAQNRRTWVLTGPAVLVTSQRPAPERREAGAA